MKLLDRLRLQLARDICPGSHHVKRKAPGGPRKPKDRHETPATVLGEVNRAERQDLAKGLIEITKKEIGL